MGSGLAARLPFLPAGVSDLKDDEIALRMDAGRKALMQRGDNETGPYQSPLEDGMAHFHEFLRREISPAL